MKRYLYPLSSFLLSLLLHSFGHASPKPNILWIIAEDMSPDLSCYGNQAIHTPNLDTLAHRGTRFDNVHVTAPACSPSRTALATGVYQTSLGAHHMRYSEPLKPVLPSAVLPLPLLLQQQGYTTGNIKAAFGAGTGKDDWLFKCSKNPWNTHSWKTLTSKPPFFGQLHISESHRPFKHVSSNVNSSKLNIPPYYPNHPVTQHDWSGYLTEILKTDTIVGKVLAELKQQNLLESTIVVFLSDHGRPMLRAKNWLYDSGTHIPLIIHIPKAYQHKAPHYQPATTNRNLISSIDLVAETLSWTNTPLPTWIQGRRFLDGSPPRSFLITAIDRVGNINTCSRAIRTHDFKWIQHFKPAGNIRDSSTYYRRATHPLYHLLPPLAEKHQLTHPQSQLLTPLPIQELYDLNKDPNEMHNLATHPNYQSHAIALQNQLKQWMLQSKDLGQRHDPPAISQYFQQYGYTQQKKRAKQIQQLKAEVLRQIKSPPQN
ncbi:sulfatase [Rubritalea tangerina]|uniref:Sulfatase n=1 Tax=Rubritalea tangerina TaxID=430798 RepID=A0ABW4Z9W8_9BACT